jgi:hypothetical protein
MSKRIYISSDYDEGNGDRAVVDEFYKWNVDNRYSLEFADLAKVASGSVSNNPDCRICDLKREFNKQINAVSAVVFIIGDRTKYRLAGSACCRHGKYSNFGCICTPYKHNVYGSKPCKVWSEPTPWMTDNFSEINDFSYLRHEFEQARKKGKKIIVVYNSLYRQPNWLPRYLEGYADIVAPFWVKDIYGNKKGNYDYIKRQLGY